MPITASPKPSTTKQMTSPSSTHLTPVSKLAPGDLIATDTAARDWAIVRSIHQPVPGVRRLELEHATTGERLAARTLPLATWIVVREQ